MKKAVIVVLYIIDVLILVFNIMDPNVSGGLCYPHHELVSSLENIILIVSLPVIIMPLIFMTIKVLTQKKRSKKTIDYSLISLIIYLIPILLFAAKVGIEKYDKMHYELEPCTQWEDITINKQKENN